MEKQDAEAVAIEDPAAKYLKDQKAAMMSMVVGTKDPSGYRITKVFARGDEYVVYEVADVSPTESIKVYKNTKKEVDLEPIQNFQEVKDSFDRLKSVMYKTGADPSYKQRMASAIVTAILGKVDKSKELFKSIENDATEDYKHRIYGRLFYLAGAVGVTAILSIVALVVYVYRSCLFFQQHGHLPFLSYVMAYAALGGFFSISLKAKKVFAQRTIAYWMYSVYGAERLLISAVAGVAAYTLVQSNIVFTAFSSGKGGAYFVMSVAFLSGFSETLIPNYMGKLEKSP